MKTQSALVFAMWLFVPAVALGDGWSARFGVRVDANAREDQVISVSARYFKKTYCSAQDCEIHFKLRNEGNVPFNGTIVAIVMKADGKTSLNRMNASLPSGKELLDQGWYAFGNTVTGFYYESSPSSRGAEARKIPDELVFPVVRTSSSGTPEEIVRTPDDKSKNSANEANDPKKMRRVERKLPAPKTNNLCPKGMQPKVTTSGTNCVCADGQEWDTARRKCTTPTCPADMVLAMDAKRCNCPNGTRWNHDTRKCIKVVDEPMQERKPFVPRCREICVEQNGTSTCSCL